MQALEVRNVLDDLITALRDAKNQVRLQEVNDVLFLTNSIDNRHPEGPRKFGSIDANAPSARYVDRILDIAEMKPASITFLHGLRAQLMRGELNLKSNDGLIIEDQEKIIADFASAMEDARDQIRPIRDPKNPDVIVRYMSRAFEIALEDPRVVHILEAFRDDFKEKHPEVFCDDEMTIGDVERQLTLYGKAYGLPGLQYRTLRGLDPASMFALVQTRNKIERIFEALNIHPNDVKAFTNQMHTQGPWRHAKALASATRPAVQAWLMLSEITFRGRDKDHELTPEEFFEDLTRIHEKLDAAIADPQAFLQKAKESFISKCEDKIEINEHGIAISNHDDGAVAAAILGYHCCIIKSAEGEVFATANKLDFSVLENVFGLVPSIKNQRGREVTVWSYPGGRDVVKELYPGFGVILDINDLQTQNLIANQLCRGGQSIAVAPTLEISMRELVNVES